MAEQVKRCVVCDCKWTTSVECPQCFPPQPDPRDAEIARLRALLAVFVAPGAEDGCEECGGESEYCIPECMIRKGREALEGGK